MSKTLSNLRDLTEQSDRFCVGDTTVDSLLIVPYMYI
jgi:hypothetical protein